MTCYHSEKGDTFTLQKHILCRFDNYASLLDIGLFCVYLMNETVERGLQ